MKHLDKHTKIKSSFFLNIFSFNKLINKEMMTLIINWYNYNTNYKFIINKSYFTIRNDNTLMS